MKTFKLITLFASMLFALGCGQPSDPAETAEAKAKPAAKPAAKPEAKPAAKPATKPAAKPAAKPATKPAAKPATKPAAKGAAKPVAKKGKKGKKGKGAKAKPAGPPKRPNLSETKALAVLANADSSLEDKAMACDRLGAVGTAKAVPVLAALVTDKKLGDYARDGLERIPDAAAGKALIAAVDKAEGQELASLLITLGDRGDETAVPALEKFATGQDKVLADAALSSLGLVASDAAVAVIVSVLEKSKGKTKVAAAHAALRAADRNPDAAGKLRKAVAVADVPAHLKEAAGK